MRAPLLTIIDLEPPDCSSNALNSVNLTVQNRGFSFCMLHGPGWLLLIYLIYGQAILAFNYELGILMGTQESAAQITEVRVAFWYGFAFGDTTTYLPLPAAGLIGH